MSLVLGRYVLERRLAAGGMGEVYLARQTGPGGFDRTCVVKTMHRHVAKDPELVDLFLEEARLSAQLSHPHVALVYDFGQVDNIYYIAMELVEGPALRDVIKGSWEKGVFPDLGMSLRMVSQAAQALDYVTKVKGPDGAPLNLVHRDISPANLLLSREGLVKVIDFGIARARTTERVTQVGVVRGKVAYMSPEQLLSLPLDGRADIFALGLVLYELLTMRRGQQVKSLLELARMQNAPIEPVSTHRPDLPQAVVRLLDKALKRRREERFQTAMELSDACEEALGALRLVVTQSKLAALAAEFRPAEMNTASGQTPAGAQATPAPAAPVTPAPAASVETRAAPAHTPSPPAATSSAPARSATPSAATTAAAPRAAPPAAPAPSSPTAPVAARPPPVTGAAPAATRSPPVTGATPAAARPASPGTPPPANPTTPARIQTGPAGLTPPAPAAPPAASPPPDPAATVVSVIPNLSAAPASSAPSEPGATVVSSIPDLSAPQPESDTSVPTQIAGIPNFAAEANPDGVATQVAAVPNFAAEGASLNAARAPDGRPPEARFPRLRLEDLGMPAAPVPHAATPAVTPPLPPRTAPTPAPIASGHAPEPVATPPLPARGSLASHAPSAGAPPPAPATPPLTRQSPATPAGPAPTGSPPVLAPSQSPAPAARVAPETSPEVPRAATAPVFPAATSPGAPAFVPTAPTQPRTDPALPGVSPAPGAPARPQTRPPGALWAESGPARTAPGVPAPTPAQPVPAPPPAAAPEAGVVVPEWAWVLGVGALLVILAGGYFLIRGG